MIKAIRKHYGTRETVTFERDGEALLASRIAVADEVLKVLHYGPANCLLMLTDATRETLLNAMTLLWTDLASEADGLGSLLSTLDPVRPTVGGQDSDSARAADVSSVNSGGQP